MLSQQPTRFGSESTITVTAAPPWARNARREILIVGYRDFGAEIAELAQACGFQMAGFVDYDKNELRSNVPVAPVIWIDDLQDIVNQSFACAMTSTLRRAELIDRIDRLTRGRLKPASLIHPRAIVATSSQIDRGTIVGAGSILATHTYIGSFNLINRGATIGHHTRLGEFCTVGPGANIGGNCMFGPHAYVGIGATVLNHIRIGAHTIIGAGSVVTKDVPDHTQVMGVPAKTVRQDIDGR